jgi:hypothetical protein
MWIFCKSGFVSIVRHKVWPGKLLVRARVRADLENFVHLLDEIGKTTHAIEEIEKADYRFRTVATPRLVAAAVAQIVADIDYPNFKNAVHGDHNRDGAYLRVWSAMHELQTPSIKAIPPYWDGKT